MFLLELFVLEHASYELQNTAGQKQPLKDIEKRKKTAEGGREKKTLPPFNRAALTVPSPHVFAINLPSSSAWKSQHDPLPPVSLCLIHIHSRY